MKIRDLMVKLAALNPEAEVFVYGGWAYESEGPQPLETVKSGGHDSKRVSYIDIYSVPDATPSDTLIVLSE